MDYIHEDEKLGKGFDWQLTKRLMTYVRPYRWWIAVCFLFVVLITGLELLMPWLVGYTLDEYVFLPDAVIEIDADNPFRERLLEEGKGVPLPDSRILFTPSSLSREARKELDLKWQPQEYRAEWVRAPIAEERAALISQRPEVFEAVGDGWVLTQKDFDSLERDERRTFRRASLLGLRTIAMVFLGLLISRFVILYGLIWILQLSGQKILFDMRNQVFGHLVRLPMAYYDKNPVGRLVTRATNDVNAINEMYTQVLVFLFKDFFLIAGVYGLMLWINWSLGLVILGLAPLVGGIAWFFKKYARDAYREMRRKLSKLNGYIQERISGIGIVRSFAQEPRAMQTFQGINDEEYGAWMRLLIVRGIFQPAIHFISIVAVGLILWQGGEDVISRTMTIGSFVVFLSLVEMLFAPVRDIAEKYNILQGAMASAERIFEVLDEPTEDLGQGQFAEGARGRIEFDDVWFAYSDENWVLRGISFTIEPGERVALVGPTGSGKTTIMRLILRMYDIQKGTVRVDGVDVKEWDLDALRQRMAVVLQEVFLFSGSVDRNIRMLDAGISEEDARAAAEFVQADTFVSQLPGGYAEEMKERGETLSVGQRQLLAFARAVAAKPDILMLDEATANIDSSTEHLIQQALAKMLKDRTSLTIAHRLATIRESDRIMVLHHGELVESGSHDELVKLEGMYAALHSLQFSENVT